VPRNRGADVRTITFPPASSTAAPDFRKQVCGACALIFVSAASPLASVDGNKKRADPFNSADEKAMSVGRDGEHAFLGIKAGETELTVLAAGAWAANYAAAIDVEIGRLLGAGLPAGEVTIDMSAVEECDTFGVTLLNTFAFECERQGHGVKIIGLPDRFSGLVDAVQRTRELPVVEPRVGSNLQVWLKTAVNACTLAAQSAISLLDMVGAVGAWFVAMIQQPANFRLTSAVHQLDRVAVQAVPIILLTTFLIGGIIAQQGFFHFRKFGADQYVVDMVGILVLREIAVLIVAIMVAGRSGSSWTAELGSMKMREEIDALRTMGHDPVAVLILPRIIALVVALPALTFIGMLAALYGAGLVAWLYGDMNPAIFIVRLKDALSITHFKVGMIKAPFMALVIGLVACSEGLQVRGSAESLGLRTTASVVKSIFLVIVLDGLFAIYFASIGM